MDTLRNIAVVCSVLAGVAPASALEVGKVPALQGSIIETRFAADPVLGRAWIEVTVEDPRLHDEHLFAQVVHFERLAVPGLSYDAETSRIVFTREGNKVACADVTPGTKIFGRQPVVRSTGQCLIDQEHATVAEDDGFHIRYREHIELRLQLPSATAG